MATLGINRATDYTQLLEENRNLAQDLKQCQADKDFVWSLWKKLQVTNPDLTEAVGLVVQREREKAEIKDRKVLEILQMKDEKIEELQFILTSRARELEESISRKTDVQEDLAMLRREVDTLRDRNATLELQHWRSIYTLKHPRWRMRNVEHREKSLSSVHKQSLEELETDRKALQHKVQFLSTDLEKVRSEKADEMALRVQVENKLRVLDREVQQKMAKFEELVKELEEARSLLRRFEKQVRQQQQDLDYKNQELETVRNELSELWTTHNQLTEHSSQQADLIRQIQSLQTDTQKMLKNQEDAYTIENSSLQQMYHDLTGRYDQAKKMEADLRQQVLQLKKEILDKDDMISDLQSRTSRPRSPYRDNSGSFLQDDKVEPVVDLQYKCDSLQKEVDNLRRQLLERERKIEDLEEDAINRTIEFDVSRLNRHERTHSTPSRPSREFRSIGVSPMKELHQRSRELEQRSLTLRSRSVSPTRHFDLPRHRHQLQKDLDDTRVILKLKIKELNELKKAHSKRLERLKSVQENYKNVKDQLKTLEAEYYGAKKRQRKPKRADPKELRHEDSSAVWNELAYFKNENRNLVSERMALEEEIDSLRVKSSQDAATIHELRVSLETEREERAYEKKKTNRETEDVATKKSEITLLKSEVQNKNIVVERLERDLRDIRSDRDVLIEEKKMLKGEIADLKKEASQHRMDQADLKRDIQRLKRELEEEKAISKLNVSKAASPTVKTVIIKPSPKRKKQKKAININGNANTKFNNKAEDEEGWEEMSDVSEEDEDSEIAGADNCGRRIVERPAVARRAISSTDTSGDPLPARMRRSVPRSRTAHRRLYQQSEPQIQYIPAGDSQFTQRVYRAVGTSPSTGLVVGPSPSIPRRSPAQIAAIRQLKPMKQRVGYLQQQVATLRDSRSAALKTIEELKETNQQLQSDLNLANQRLKVSKHNIQKLTNDVEKAQQERVDLEKQLIHKTQESPESGHSDHDWRVLESRLKSATNELSRQNAAVRQLKQDNEAATDQIRILQDKLARMERDNNQKRTLLEDQRTRVKQALENAKSDAESLEALETRTKLMQDNNERLKVQMESYKKRLGAVTREKREYEEKFLKLTQEVQKKDRIVLDCQSKKMELESALSEMEKTATQQMKCLARESEDALETAKDKLREIGLTLQAYQRFIRSLSQELVRRTQQTRSSIKEESLKKSGADHSTASMQKAQDVAKNILNLSQSDLEEIMSADGEAAKKETELETEKRRDKKWLKKIDRVQNSKDDFAMALTDLILEKMEERNELTAKLWTSKVASQSEVKVDNT